MCSCYFTMSNDSAEIVSVSSSYSKPEQGEKDTVSATSLKDRVAPGLAAKLYYCQWDWSLLPIP